MAENKTLPILELNVSEENEIGFKLRIEGSDKDIGASKPNVRFVVTETSSGKGWIFSATKTEDGGVAINVPVMKGIVTENNKYHGKLEVILGGRYFTPTEVDISFIEPLKVEAAMVSSVSVKNKSNNNTQALLESHTSNGATIKAVEEEELFIESEIDSIIVKESVTNNVPSNKVLTPIKEAITTKQQTITSSNIPVIKNKLRNYNELSASEKEAVNKLFLEKCNKYDMSPKEVKRLMTEGTSITKKKLTALWAQSIKEYIES